MKVLGMTSKQQQLVRETFPSLHEVAEPLVQLFYGRLFQIAPSVRSLFKSEIDVQARKFSDMLEALVKGLEDFEQQLPALRALGQKHVAYGVVPSHYDVVATAFLWALDHMLYPDFSPEVRGAWQALLDEVNAAMKAGAAELGSGTA